MRLLFIKTVLVIATSTILAQGMAFSPNPKIEVSKKSSLIDEVTSIKICYLEPKERIQIKAEAVDEEKSRWISSGCYEADFNGEVNLTSDPSIEGTYEGIDPMGLFWSMKPASGKPSEFKVKQDAYTVGIKLLRQDQEIDCLELQRVRRRSDVAVKNIHENGLQAILYTPKSDKPLPVVITLSGSNGGFGENRAKLIASHDFAVLALAYFGKEGLPQNLENIPLEYFMKAIKWIESQPDLDGSKIGIFGASRGAELSLILAALFPEKITSVVAVAPSSLIQGALSEKKAPAWTLNGKGLPFASVPHTDFSNGVGESADNPASTLFSFLKASYDESAVIPVEKIKAKILVITGGDDQMWPSEQYVEEIKERLHRFNVNKEIEHLHYPKAGHCIGIPNMPQPGSLYYHPVGKKWFTVGGTEEADQKASCDSWGKLISFFEKTLK